MKKNLIGNVALMLFTTAVMLVVMEVVFRWVLFSDIKAFSSLRNPSYYADYIKEENEDFCNENYWKLQYLFNKSFNVENPNPLLCWTGYFNKETYRHTDEAKAKDKRPVLLYGDSFAMCVDSVECFEDILNSDTSFTAQHYLLNYGAGGYGVDQIYLLFNETADKFEHPFVIFSLLTTNMDRSMLKVRDAHKPYFVLTDDGLELQGVPITLTSQEYFEQNPPEITSYLWNKFKSSKLYPFKQSEEVKREYIEKIKELNKLILQEAFRKLKALNADYVVLLFQPEHHTIQDWRLAFLRDLCEENEVPYICDLDIRMADSTYSTYNPYRYAIKADGHPTSYSNALISRSLKQYILHADYRKYIASQNLSWKGRKQLKSIEYYKEQIKNAPQWLEAVKAKAEDKGIPLDSMILLDARYMEEHQQ